MKYWMMMACLLFVMGCGDPGPKNIMDNADQQALDDYEKALAEADAMEASAEEE